MYALCLLLFLVEYCCTKTSTSQLLSCPVCPVVVACGFWSRSCASRRWKWHAKSVMQHTQFTCILGLNWIPSRHRRFSELFILCICMYCQSGEAVCICSCSSASRDHSLCVCPSILLARALVCSAPCCSPTERAVVQSAPHARVRTALKIQCLHASSVFQNLHCQFATARLP